MSYAIDINFHCLRRSGRARNVLIDRWLRPRFACRDGKGRKEKEKKKKRKKKKKRERERERERERSDR